MNLATAYSLHILSDTFTVQTGIPVEIDFLPQNQILKRIMDTSDSPEPVYDIYMYDVPWTRYMVQNSLLADITDYVTGSDFDRSMIFPENLENCMIEDYYYGIPIIGGSQMMFYRKDLFERHEIAKAFKREYNLSLRPLKNRDSLRRLTHKKGLNCAFFSRIQSFLLI